MKICVIIWCALLVYIAVIVGAYHAGRMQGLNESAASEKFFVESEKMYENAPRYWK